MTRWEWIKAVASPTGPEQPTTRHVLLTLATHMGLSGDNCRPSISKRLVPETGLGERTVRKHLELAEEDGWIEREKRGRGYSYHARIPAPDAGIEEEPHRHELPVSDGPDPTPTPAPDAGIEESGHRHELPVSSQDRTPAPDAAAAPDAGVHRHQMPESPSTKAEGKQLRGVTTTDSLSPSGRSSPRHDPVLELMRSAAQEAPDWRHEHPTAQEVVGWWIDLRNGSRPPGPEISKQGAVAKRLASRHTRSDVIRALVGIAQLYPHSDGEPYDLFDVERKFAKAHDAFERHPAVQKYLFLQQMRSSS